MWAKVRPSNLKKENIAVRTLSEISLYRPTHRNHFESKSIKQSLLVSVRGVERKVFLWWKTAQ